MKKLSVVVFILMITAIVFAGNVTKTYYISSPEIISKDGLSSIFFEKAMLTGEVGSPALPYLGVSLLLPPGEIAKSIKFIGGDLKEIPGEFKLRPYQTSKPLSDPSRSDLIFNDDIYKLTENYPSVGTGGLSTGYLYGHSIAMSTFTPIIYVPSEGRVSYFSKVSIVIETEPDPSASDALKNLVLTSHTEKELQNFVQNTQDASQYKSISTHRDEGDYNLLIITTDQYSGGFEELRNIYLSRGIVSEVVTTETIAALSNGQDLQEQIRNYIIQEYQGSNIEYVLLGGDVEYIPHRGFYCYVESGGGYESNDIPADLYYSALDGNWNDDGDNKWGEPDEDDLLPEVAVARFPFSNASELATMIHKSIQYQNNPVLGELTNPLLAGENLYSGPDTWGRDYLDLIIGERSDNGYTTIGIPENYPIDSLYEHDGSWGGSDLMNEINQGKQFVHHVGHASPSYVAHLNSSDITNSNFYGANGIDHNFTLLQTHGCDCGSFDYDDCILEKMVTIDNFAVSVIGNSRFGWFNEGQTEGPSAHLHREMVDALYHEKMNKLGLAFVESKIQTAPWVEAPGQWEEGALRWNFYDINILGDPTLSVWTAEPIEIDVTYEEDMEVGSNTTDVNVISDGVPMEDFTCTIIMDGILHATGNTDMNGDVTLTLEPPVTSTGEAMLIVVGYNCLPDTNIIHFIPSGEAYVIYNAHIVTDPSGNNNGLVDFGESVLLDMAISNIGMVDAVNVMSTLSVVDEYVTITDNTEQYGNMTAGTTLMIDGAFSFDVLSTVPDQHIIEFILVCESNGQTWNSNFEVVVQAPFPEIGNLIIDDNTAGNGNNRLDPGETASLFVELTNDGHSECSASLVNLSVDNPYLIINPDVVNIDLLGIGESVLSEFSVIVDELIPVGTSITYNCQLDMCGYIAEEIYHDVIGLVIEDFETGDFTAFDWQMGGDADWVITNDNPFNGSYSSKSGNISNNRNSELIISVFLASSDEITFARKVSSEDTYDKLKYYVDGVKIAEWSGEKDWEVVSYELSAGQHILTWTYEKDINSVSGSDCGWVDDIIFPPSATVIGVGETILENSFSIFPNPGTGIFSLQINSDLRKANVVVYNTLGNRIESISTMYKAGLIKLNLVGVEPGLYFVEVQAGENRMIKKVIVN